MVSEITIESMMPMRNQQVSTQKTYVGIDFGTSTTVVSVATFDNVTKKLKVESIPLVQLMKDGARHYSDKLPTVIAWYNKHIFVGEGASSMKYELTKGKNVWYSFKMELGADLGPQYYDSELADHEKFRIQSPKDATRVFFAYLKILIHRYCEEHKLSTIIEYAITIPASFEANQRRDLLEALSVNGMKLAKQSLIDEPNAAFISYIQACSEEETTLKMNLDYNPKVLVFDFGAGTCDISILEVGKSVDGLYSKNLAISKFVQMGGDDIDRYITYHYLMPRFLEANGHKMSDYRTMERKEIATQLYKVAEQLKIMISKELGLLMNDFKLPKEKNSDDKKATMNISVTVETTKGRLSQDSFYLSYKEMTETMNVFLQTSRLPRQVQGEMEYNNIYIPVNNAIEKSHVNKDEIDFVLLIGGSAQNPYVQESLKKYFADSDILVPRDLQTHVSQGAAIHSLLINGMNKCLVQPIISEPLILITKDNDGMRVLLPAGTPIPSEKMEIDDLVTIRDNQKVIELPICVGTKRKMLFNLKIERESGFPINSKVSVTLVVNADKMVEIEAECMDERCMTELQNPFLNKEMSAQERAVVVAERESNFQALANSGVPTQRSLTALSRVYERCGQYYKAAETYEYRAELYPESANYNYIAIMYSKSGNEVKKREFFERAVECNPENDIYISNLGVALKYVDPEKYQYYMKRALEINPSNAVALIECADIAAAEDDMESAKEKRNRAYELLRKEWDNDSIDEAECSWLASVAEKLGMKDFAKEVRKKDFSGKEEEYYDDNNLIRTKTIQLTKI